MLKIKEKYIEVFISLKHIVFSLQFVIKMQISM